MTSDLQLITPKLHSVVLDIRYATLNNCTGLLLYKKPLCFLRKEAKLQLEIAIQLAKEKGYIIKIYDAYRPLSIQQKMWDIFQDNRYISNPAEGIIPHCRGVAIDLTLLDNDTLLPLNMGTEFDDFSDKSHHGNSDILQEAQENRFILSNIMESANFESLKTEWWHYHLPNFMKYPVIDESLEKTELV